MSRLEVGLGVGQTAIRSKSLLDREESGITVLNVGVSLGFQETLGDQCICNVESQEKRKRKGSQGSDLNSVT